MRKWPAEREISSFVMPSTPFGWGVPSASLEEDTSRASRTRSNEHVPLHVHPFSVGPIPTPSKRSTHGPRTVSGVHAVHDRSFLDLFSIFFGRSSAGDRIARPSCARRTCRRRACTSHVSTKCLHVARVDEVFARRTCRRRVCTSMGVHYTGVRAQGTRFRADITVNGIKKHLGSFDTAEGAARAYDRAKVEAKGPQARGLNFPEEHRPSASVRTSPKKTPTTSRRAIVQEHEAPTPRSVERPSGRVEEEAVEENGGRRSGPSSGGVLEGLGKAMAKLAQYLTLTLLLVGLVLGILMPLRGTPAFDKIMSTSQEVLNVGKYTDMMHQSWLWQELPLRVERAVDNLPLEGAYALAERASRKLEVLRMLLFERSRRSCAADVNRDVLKSMVETPDGVWLEVVERMMEDFNQSYHNARPADAAKALVALFLTPSKSAVEKVRGNMDKAFSRCAEQDCLLKINLKDYGDLNANLQQIQEWKGSVQLRLANFLRRCPSGVVFIEDLLSLHPLVVPALSNGMGEQGAYFQDGTSVGASQATFVLTTGHLPMETAGLTEEQLSTMVKGKIVSTFSMAEDDILNTQDDRVIFANAFRRRIDYIIPVKSPAYEQEQGVI